MPGKISIQNVWSWPAYDRWRCMLTVLGCVIVISGASAMDSIRPQTLFQVVSLRALAIVSLDTWTSLCALLKSQLTACSAFVIH